MLRRAEVLFQGDRSAMMVPLSDGQIHYVSESIEPQYRAGFVESITALEPGAVRFSDTSVDMAGSSGERKD